ncbi:unnamed protein product [Caenorhabditis auriculariae]|uniref:C2H2-type domain-containing protein n=1 Tax=Caenorhabditis auriculariae TaxID=2777116 RepID=A0A8S1HQC1_9PELO|nr:unnamed protein product [Caenorhabditis auriculariae]
MEAANLEGQASTSTNVQKYEFCVACQSMIPTESFQAHVVRKELFGVCDKPSTNLEGLILCKPCGAYFSIVTYRIHLHKVHSARCTVRKEVFNCEKDFSVFRTQLQSLGTKFRKTSGFSHHEGVVYENYRCFQSQARVIAPNSEKEVPLFVREEFCTAFLNKHTAEDGKITVLYCVHHLHDDPDTKFPDKFCDRVLEMQELEYPVSRMVRDLKAEADNFAEPGTDTHRRIQSLTVTLLKKVCFNVMKKKMVFVSNLRPPSNKTLCNGNQLQENDGKD